MSSDSKPTSSQSAPAQAGAKAAHTPDLLARGWGQAPRTFWAGIWREFSKFRSAIIALYLMGTTACIAVLAPLLANQRPFYLYVPESLPVDARQGFSPGWHFPLFAALRISDWMLIFGAVQALAALGAWRHARKNAERVNRAWTLTLAVFSTAPIGAALLVSPALHRDLSSSLAEVAQGVALPVWIGCGIGLLVGLWWLATAIPGLLLGKRDDLGILRTNFLLTRWLAGSLLILPLASQAGTLAQLQIDNTDYWALARSDPGVHSLFPPICHDFAGPQNYAVSQPPGAPFVRVSPAGGSQAAADLALTDSRMRASLQAELSDGAVFGLETPLAALRRGQGVRSQGDGSPDFLLVARDFTRFPVSLAECATVGDIAARIAAASSGRITATLSADGTRLALTDSGPARPTHWFGTDDNGRDVAARIVHATRVALSIGFVSTGIAVLIGIVAGALMGFFGGWVDIVGMRIIEIFMAIPTLFLLLTIIAFIPPEWSDYLLYAMMAVIGLTSWMVPARFIRAEFLKLRDMDYIQAATACGLPLRSVLFRHMLPNGVTPVLVHASFGVAVAILTETALSFLGFGIKPPNPSWGQMLSSAVGSGSGLNWWMAVFPGFMIFMTVFSLNIIGDALRDAIDPRARKAAAI